MLVELYSLLGRRIGLSACVDFRRSFEPLLDVVWIDRTLHDQAIDLLFQLGPGCPSLVDASAFVTMRRLGVEEAFTFDQHFARAGFRLVT